MGELCSCVAVIALGGAPLPGQLPGRPSLRIAFATVLREMASPSARRSARILGAAETSSDSPWNQAILASIFSLGLVHHLGDEPGSAAPPSVEARSLHGRRAPQRRRRERCVRMWALLMAAAGPQSVTATRQFLLAANSLADGTPPRGLAFGVLRLGQAAALAARDQGDTALSRKTPAAREPTRSASDKAVAAWTSRMRH